MMSEFKVCQLLIEAGAVITDSHIVYTSGKHGSTYINKDAVYPHTGLTSQLCFNIAAYCSVTHPLPIHTVIGPAIGGAILAQWTAHHLTKYSGYPVKSVFAEKMPDGEAFVIKRGYDKHICGKRVLVVDDVLTTGRSVKKVVDAVCQAGGIVTAVAVLCNRGGVSKEDVGDPPRFVALANITLEAWDEAACPLCKQSVPIATDVGHGRQFLARQRQL